MRGKGKTQRQGQRDREREEGRKGGERGKEEREERRRGREERKRSQDELAVSAGRQRPGATETGSRQSFSLKGAFAPAHSRKCLP